MAYKNKANYQIDSSLAWSVLSSTTKSVITIVKVLFFATTSTSNKTILSMHVHRVTRWREQRCLDCYRHRQIGQSDCDFTAKCGKAHWKPKNIYCTLRWIVDYDFRKLNSKKTFVLIFKNISEPTTAPILRTTNKATTKATTTQRPRITLRPRTVTSRPTQPDLCDSSVRYDAVSLDPRRRMTYFFVGNWFWIVDRRLRRSGPFTIKSFWKEVKTPVDAVYRNKRRNIVFFKGTE